MAGLFVFFASFAFAMSIPENDDLSVSVQSDRDPIKGKAKDAVATDWNEEYKMAKKCYFGGEWSRAEGILNKLLFVNPNNKKAANLQSKISFLNEKKAYYEREVINAYLSELRKTVEDDNFYEGFAYINKIRNISRDEELGYYIQSLTHARNDLLSKIDNETDKRRFLKSIDAFSDEDFKKFERIVKKLQKKYPYFDTFINIGRLKDFEEYTEDRANALYNKTVRYLKKNNFVQAQNTAQLLYIMDMKDIRARLLLDQIDMETK